MFYWDRKEAGCRKYRAQIEDSVLGGAAHMMPGSELDKHVHACESCREALDDALLAGMLMRNAQEPAVQPSEAFVTRVMASIRQEVSQQAAPGAIWRPVEVLASRFAMAATVALLVLSFFAVKSKQQSPAISTATVTSAQTQTEIGAGLPERPAVPANQDEVLMSLVGSDSEQ